MEENFLNSDNNQKKNLVCGFIGQGWIGKNYALDFEERGFSVVRYSNEPEFLGNKEKIASCDVVFIAVPTPTTPEGFDGSIVEEVLPLVGPGNIAVIKSTIIPGTTQSLQKKFPDIFILHSPEFLTEANARYDASHPKRNIIGIPADTEVFRAKAEIVLTLLPSAPYTKVMESAMAEFIKYAANSLLYTRVVFANVLYDMSQTLGLNWSTAKEALAADPRIGSSHLDPVHESGRGAGGHCFIKDFATFRELYENLVGDKEGLALLHGLEEKNNALLTSSNKDIPLLTSVYGESHLKKFKNLSQK